ncbi:MAG TPA: MBL fold metallo-hydrolase [Flavihumibacter sp.]|jgi:L-ascorbate metabolism protein UlaG (beta-lactamase superfamily)
MKIHHIRNATMVVEIGNRFILVDPMLGRIGESAPPFSFFRFKKRRNPVTNLPETATGLLDRVSHCLITHLHADHIDKAGVEFLKTRSIPVTCSVRDVKRLRAKGLTIVRTLDYWEEADFYGGTIQGIPARHGYGFAARLAGPVMGYFIRFAEGPSLYLASDTIYTDDVRRVLTEYKPTISVIPAGSAQLDMFQPLMMRVVDILDFVRDAPGLVIANHMEALNHCPNTRKELRVALSKDGLEEKVWIPVDGEGREFSELVDRRRETVT